MSSVAAAREVSRIVLSNGIRVITEPMPHVRSASIGVWIATGARRESAAEAGISHFIEHMLFKGTQNRSAEDIAKVIDSTGGNLDAYTSKELVSYNTKVIDDHIPLAFDVLSDLVLHPLFQAEDVEKEKGVILEELKMETDNPEYLVHETFFSRFWRNHPLGRPIIGTRKTIQSFTRDHLSGYYRSVYVPGNMVITAAGRIEPDTIVKFVQDYFGHLDAQLSNLVEPEPKPQSSLVLKKKRSLEQLHLCMGVPAFPMAHPDRYALYVLSTILGGGMSSRLFQKVREQQGLAYAVFSELNLYRDGGCLAVYAGTSPDTASRVARMVVAELRDLCHNLVGDEELKRGKDHLKGSLALSLESTSSRMSNLARQELFFNCFFTVDEMVEAIEQVTAARIQSIAQELFGGKQVGLTALGRTASLDISEGDLVI